MRDVAEIVEAENGGAVLTALEIYRTQAACIDLLTYLEDLDGIPASFRDALQAVANAKIELCHTCGEQS